MMTHVLKHGLHECDSNFSLLYEIIFGVLYLQTGLLLLRWACCLERLLRRVKLETRGGDGMARLHSNSNTVRKRTLPRCEKLCDNVFVLLQTSS